MIDFEALVIVRTDVISEQIIDSMRKAYPALLMSIKSM